MLGDTERNCADLFNEMKLCYERCTELEDRSATEKNLRKQIEREYQDGYDEKNKVRYDRKVDLPMKAVNQTQVQMNLTIRNLRPGREVVLQTGKGSKKKDQEIKRGSRRNLKCTKK